jgi:hypothetical protein
MRKITTLFFTLLMLPSRVFAFSVEHDFFVTVGAFDASLTQFTYTLEPNAYGIKSVVSTNGVFATLYPFQAEYKTSGKIGTDSMITTDYTYSSRSRFKTRSKQVLFDKEGKPVSQISTRNGKTRKRKFEQSPSPADTYDLQTVIAKLTRQYNDVGFCDSRLAVYDGKRRFDVIFTDEGNDTLVPNEHSSYQGKAVKCALQIDKLLSDDDDTLWQFSANRPIYFWLMRDEATGHPFIAKIQIKDTPLGELNAYLTKTTIKE